MKIFHLIAAILLFITDLVTKYLIRTSITAGEELKLWGDINLIHRPVTDMILKERLPLYVGLVISLVLIIKQSKKAAPITLIFAGVAANLVYNIKLIELGPLFPTFNIADFFIVVSAVFMMISTLKDKELYDE